MQRLPANHSHRLGPATMWLIFWAALPSLANGAPPSIEQVNDALDIAEIAAREGLTDVSTAAVGRALAYGIPEHLQDAEHVNKLRPNVLIDTISPVPLTPAEAIRVRIPRSLFALSQLWSDAAEPRAAYAALRDVVMPPQRPGLFVLYNLPMKVDPASPDQLPVTKSIAQEVVVWATRAKCLGELSSHIGEHQPHRSVEGAVLRLMCAGAMRDQPLIDRYSAELVDTMKAGNSRETAELVASVAADLNNRNSSRLSACALLEVAGQTLNRIDTLKPIADSPARAILLAAARIHFSEGSHKKAVAALKDYLSVKVRDANGVKSVGATHLQQETAGRELFRRGLASAAGELLEPDVFARLQDKYAPAGLSPMRSGAATMAAVTSEEPPGTPRISSRTQIAALPPDNDIWICRHDLESHESTVLFTLPDFTSVADPVVCANGQRVAFAATRPGEAVTSDKRLYITDINGHSLSCLGRGTLPSWSPQGERLVFSCFAPEGGVWLTDITRNDRVLLDGTGWGGCWSPDGSRIAYAKAAGRRWDIVLRDIVENETLRLFAKRGVGPATIAGGFAWSAQSNQLIYATNTLGTSAAQVQKVNAVDVSGQMGQRSLYQADTYLGRRVCWLGDSIADAVCSLRLRPNGLEQLYVINAGRDQGPTLVTGQVPGRRNSNVSSIPSGGAVIYVSKPVGRR